MADVLGTLADSRLVTVGEGSVEVAHEALLREWPRLRDWIEEDAEGRRLRRHVTQAATEWDTTGRDKGELYRGARLAAALDWSTDHAFELNELERGFVSESREASEHDMKRERRTNRRLRALLAGVAVLLAAAVAGGIYASVQRGDARDAETAQVAQRLGAQALVEEDLARSLLLARQAVAIDNSPQTRGYLLAALRRSPAAIGIMHGAGQLRAIAVSPGAKTLAVVGNGIGLVFFDARSFEQIRDPLPDFTAESLRYSPDGRTLAIGGDRYLRLIDAQTGQELAKESVGGAPMRMAFTKDGSQLVILVTPGPIGALGGADATICDPGRRHAEADRSLDRAGGLRRRLRRFPVRVSSLRPHGGRSLARHSVRGRRAGMVGSPEPTEDADSADRSRVAACRAHAQPGRSHRGGRYRRRHPARRRADRRRRERQPPDSPAARTGCCSARTARRSFRRTSTGP